MHDSRQKTRPEKLFKSEVNKSFKTRKEGMKKKAMELATLCDVEVCLMIQLPNGDFEIWPENPDQVRHIFHKYCKKQEEVQAKKTSQHSIHYSGKQSIDCADNSANGLLLNSDSKLGNSIAGSEVVAETNKVSLLCNDNSAACGFISNFESQLGQVDNEQKCSKQQETLKLPIQEWYEKNGFGNGYDDLESLLGWNHQPLPASTSEVSFWPEDCTGVAGPSDLGATIDTNWQLNLPSAETYQGFSHPQDLTNSPQFFSAWNNFDAGSFY